ncbi:MAG: hypothetical protein ACPW61_03395 [Methyloligella sp. ZOD6]
MTEEQTKGAGTAGGQQDDYAKIEGALQRSPRGRWFLAEYARRNRNADTALVLAAIERLESVVKSGAEDMRSSQDATPAEAETAAGALPLAGLKENVEIASRDVAAMEQATKDATADILIATESIQDFTWQMRDTGIDRHVCGTIERHTADIYAACTFQDVVHQRKANALHLLRLMAETLEAALGGASGSDDRAASSSSAAESFDALLSDIAPSAESDEAELEIPLAPEFVADEDATEQLADETNRDETEGVRENVAIPEDIPATVPADSAQSGSLPPASEPLVQTGPPAFEASEIAGREGHLAALSNRLDSTKRAVLFG